MKIYDQYNNPRSKGQTFENGRPTQVQQHFLESCDIDVIMRKFKKTGVLPQVQKIPQYGDFSNVGSYQEALQKINSVNETFSSLPARVRDSFNNDPGKLLDFLSDSNNQARAIELGLIENKEQIVPVNTGTAPSNT